MDMTLNGQELLNYTFKYIRCHETNGLYDKIVLFILTDLANQFLQSK